MPEIHFPRCAIAATVYSVAGFVVKTFAAERMGRRGHDIDLVVAARTAPVLAAAGGIHAEFLTMEHHRVQLFVNLHVRHGQTTKGADMTNLVESVAPVDCAGTGCRRAVIKHVRMAAFFLADGNAEHILGPSGATSVRIGLR